MIQLSLGVPQIIYLAICAFNVCYAAVNHGKPQGEINAYTVMAGAALGIALLTWGGFFS